MIELNPGPVSSKSIHLLKCIDARAVFSKSVAAFYRDVADGLIPKPVSPGGRRVAWPDHELQEIVKARIAGKTEEDIRALVKKLEEDRKQLA